MQPAHPERLGSYELATPLGRGGMGVVYLARHRDSGTQVALKTLTRVGPARVRAIRREIAALGRLRHPHIVRILDDGVSDEGMPWYAMELLEGGLLANRLNTVPVRAGADDVIGSATWTMRWAEMSRRSAPGDADTQPQAASQSDAKRRYDERSRADLGLLTQVTHALAYLHGEGFVHCDLKPENVFVTPEGRAVLVDFGLVLARGQSTLLADLEEAGLAIGTARYLAPERIRGEVFDTRLDLYALGCMLFEVLTGHPAFHRDNVAATLRAHVNAAIPRVSDSAEGVPKTLTELCAALLAKRPDRRPSHALAVFAELSVLSESAAVEPLPAPRAHLHSAALVGRSAVLERCFRAFEPSRINRHHVLILRGESGVGKSRLAAEVVGRVRGDSTAVLVGQCTVARAPGRVGQTCQPLGAFSRVLETIVLDIEQVARQDGEQGRLLAQRVVGAHGSVLAAYWPRLRSLPGATATAEAATLTGEAARLRVFRAMRHVLAAYVEGRTGVMVLEDLQWADELSLGTLDYLRRTLRECPLLIIGTCRSDEVFDELGALVRSDGVETIDVERLPNALMRQMVRSMLGTKRVPPSLDRFVERHAAGNPFFVVSCLRAALEEGYLHLDARGQWAFEHSSELAEAPMPTTLTALLERRLALLRSEALALVRAASVLGRVMELELLEQVAALADVDGALSTLIERHIMEPEPLADRSDSVYRFVHDKLAEVTYDSLSQDAATRLHQRASQALSTRAAEGHVVDLGKLAWHQQLGGDPAQARLTYLAACRDAIDRYAHQDAERLLEAGLALRDGHDEQSLTLLVHFIDEVLVHQGRMERAEGLLDLVLDTPATKALPAAHAAALRCKGVLLWRTGQLQPALAMLDRAAEAARAAGDALVEASAFGNRGNVHHAQGRHDEAVTWYSRALDICRDRGDRRGELIWLGNMGNVHRERGGLEEALTAYTRALEIARQIGERRGESIWLGNVGIVRRELGHPDEALSLYRQALEITREIGNRRGELLWLGNMGNVLREQGHHEDALELFRQALEISSEVGERRGEAIWLVNIGLVHREQGRLDAAAKVTIRALEIARGIGSGYLEGILLVELGRLRRLRGDLDAADYALRQAAQILDESGFPAELAECWCELGQVALAKGEPATEALRRAEALLEPFSLRSNSDPIKALDGLKRAIEAAT